jgi:hypothetical protein
MDKYGFLSKYSQQSHEAMDALMTHLFFCRTQLGGFVSTMEERSKLRPLARWVQHQLMWLCGQGDKVFTCDSEDQREKVYSIVTEVPIHDDDGSGNYDCPVGLWGDASDDEDGLFDAMPVTATYGVEGGVEDGVLFAMGADGAEDMYIRYETHLMVFWAKPPKFVC